MHESIAEEASGPTPDALTSLAAIDCAAVWQDVEVARTTRAMLHPVLKERLVASALCTEVLVLAACILFAKFTGTTGKNLKAENAMIHLVCQRQKARVVHVRVLCRDVIEGAALHVLPL